LEEDVEIIGTKDCEIISTKDLIKVDYLPKNKSPISNLFLVAPLFTPCSRNIKAEDKYREIRIEDQFGYSVEVLGPRLNMSVDFPIWSHFIRLVIESQSNEINMHYVDFAKILGYNRKNLGAVLKNRIRESIIRLSSQTIITEDDHEDGEEKIISLLDSGVIKKKTKEVSVVVNKEAIRLYKIDRFQLIDLEFYNNLQNEITKALFLYYENHGHIVYPLKLENIITRLNLVSKNDKEINRQIKNGHKNLVDVNYLSDFDYDKKNGSRYIHVKKGSK